MLPDVTLPPSLAVLLEVFQPCFTAPSYRMFRVLVVGFLAQTGCRSVCGMLVGAGLSRWWPHDRAHYFFARARCSPDRLGLTLAALVVSLLAGDGDPVLVAIDDTLFKRRGKKVRAASWFHDGSAIGAHPVAYGNSWVVLGIVVPLPFCSRPVCLPVLARLVVKDTTSASRLYLARRVIDMLAGALPATASVSIHIESYGVSMPPAPNPIHGLALPVTHPWNRQGTRSSYRVKRAGDQGIRHAGLPAIKLANFGQLTPAA